MLEILWIAVGILIFMAGASVFSFLNVVIYRVPRHLSFVTGRSMCPHCGKTLRGADMVPVLNWIFLRGKCHYCKAPISLRYPLVELTGGAAALLCVWRFGFSTEAALVFVFLSILTVIAFVDQDTMEIPNGFVIAVLVTAVVSMICLPEPGIAERLIGMLAVSVPLFLMTVVIPGAFGGGDIKLMAAAGLFLGWRMAFLSFFFAVLGGGIYGIYLLVSGRKERKDHFAFGPFLCIGMTAAVFVGEEVLSWYLGLLV